MNEVIYLFPANAFDRLLIRQKQKVSNYGKDDSMKWVKQTKHKKKQTVFIFHFFFTI